MKNVAWSLVLLMTCAVTVHAAEIRPTCGRLPVPGAPKMPVADLSGPLPVADFADSIVTCMTSTLPGVPIPPTPPRSPWLESGQKQYAALLAGSKYSWLILPAQTQYFGFDRIERMLISAVIADAFEGAGSFPDPMLVARALGEVRRTYNAADVAQLTNSIGAQRRLEVFAGHDGERHMTLTLRLKECAADGVCKVVKQHDWRALPFSNQQMPFMVVAGLKAQMRGELLGKTAPPNKPGKPGGKSNGALPASIGVGPAVLSGKIRVVSDAALTALLANLASPDDEFGYQRLQSRALWFALADGTSPGSRFLAAHAALHLYRRPYAISLLDGLTDPAAGVLRSLLDGNLLEAQRDLPKVAQPFARLLLALDVQDLRKLNDRNGSLDQEGAAKLFGAALNAWQPLIDRRATDHDPWGRYDSLAVKHALDENFPVAGLDALSLTKGALVAGEDAFDTEQMEIANFRHLGKVLAQLKLADCCAVDRASGGSWQMYWLLESTNLANVFKAMDRRTELQGIPEDTLRLAARYDAWLAGHPLYEARRRAAALARAKKVSPDLAAPFTAQAQAAEQIATYWMLGQSPAGRPFMNGMVMNLLIAEAIYQDFPRRPFWRPTPLSANAVRDLCDSADYSVDSSEPAELCFDRSSDVEKPALRAALDQRFHIYPGADSPFLDASVEPTSEEFQRQLRAKIVADPETWQYYFDLGHSLSRDSGKYEDAQKVFLSYPGFKQLQHENTVGLSNAADDAASELWWHGRYDLARPLFQIAADLDTGSQASMRGAERIALLDGDYEGAAEASLAMAQRYPNAPGFRDYLALLHVLGHGEEAQVGFSQLKEEFETPQLWQSTLVGQRMQGMSYEQFKQWILKPEIRDAHHVGLRYAPIYALWWATIERTPPADFPQLMAQIEKNAIRKIDTDGKSVLFPSHVTDGGFMQDRPSSFRAGKSPSFPPGTVVPSEHVLLADAMTSLRAARYPEAVQKFVALSDRYDIESGDLEAALGYFALAAAKTGDKIGLEHYIETQMHLPNLDFDVLIARAMFAAVRHDPPKAQAALVRAFQLRAVGEARGITTEYEYAEACEIARRETGDRRFDAMVLEWARLRQKTGPMYAWTYAMEASHSSVPVDVTRALALTIYLDPQSPRLKQFDAQQIAAARAWLKANNPFLQAAPEKKPQRGVQVVSPRAAPAT